VSGSTELRQWVADRAELDDRLYEHYGKALESKHTGEFIAISNDGQLIRGTDELAVATKASKEFGPGNFALRRIGADAEIRWRRPGA
jgi:hypothetical protein